MQRSNVVVEEINDQNLYENYSQKMSAHFLQSWEWGEFKKEYGWIPVRVFFKHENKIIGLAQLLIKKIKNRKLFAYIPRGPEITVSNMDSLKKVFNNLKIFIRENYSEIAFIRFEMDNIEKVEGKQVTRNEKVLEFIKKNYKKSPYDIQVKDTRKLKLIDRKKLWDSFKSNQRRKIRKAKKYDVKIFKTKSEKIFKKWFRINKKTASRANYFIHPYGYYKKYFNSFIKNDLANLYIAEFENKIVGGIIVVFYNEEAIYQYGASLRLKKNVYSNEALQWKAIKDAEKKGLKNYDFWGVSPDEKDKTHPWYGISKFKRQFGGNHITYMGSYDIPVHGIKYYILIILEKLRKKYLKIKKYFRKK